MLLLLFTPSLLLFEYRFKKKKKEEQELPHCLIRNSFFFLCVCGTYPFLHSHLFCSPLPSFFFVLCMGVFLVLSKSPIGIMSEIHPSVQPTSSSPSSATSTSSKEKTAMNTVSASSSSQDPPTESRETMLLHHIKGEDSEGREYDSTDSFWKTVLKGDLYDKKNGWYGKALHYWENVSADIKGVLGGLDEVHQVDIIHTTAFLTTKLDASIHERTRALDCAAGIGRVAKHVLTLLYEKVDLLEPVPHMLEKAKEELAGNPHVGHFMLSSMETVSLPPKTYDLIMIQWAVIYLTDDDFVRFFSDCKAALRTPGGYIVLKDNVTFKNYFLVDNEDSSLTRSDEHYKLLFKKAGLQLKAEALQEDWRNDLLPVKMYALQ